MSKQGKAVLAAIAIVALVLLSGQCGYTAGEWLGRN
jgi:hypothetical protein